MNRLRISVAVSLLVGATAAGVLLASNARSQIVAGPSYLPVGVSTSGNASTAWFHEPSTRQALACQTVSQGGNLTAIQCVRATLPN